MNGGCKYYTSFKSCLSCPYPDCVHNPSQDAINKELRFRAAQEKAWHYHHLYTIAKMKGEHSKASNYHKQMDNWRRKLCALEE